MARVSRMLASLALTAASRAQRRLHGFGALGAGSLVRPPYTITGARRIFIGRGTIIGPNALLSVVTEHRGERFEPMLRIGDGCSIGQNFVVSCLRAVTVGSRVLISSDVFIGDSMHEYEDPARAVIDQPMRYCGAVRIGDGAFIGIGAIIMPGVSVGRHAVVGAGSVVTHDVPDFCVVAGNPARTIKRYDAARGAWVSTAEAGAPRGRATEAAAGIAPPFGWRSAA